jgi:FAD/FMN-containing dehydrogenase
VTTTVNDIHSELNETAVAEVVAVDSLSSVSAAGVRAASEGLPVAVAGGRHAMGGQQFCRGGMLLDTRTMARVLELDRELGTVEVESGIQWPALIDYLESTQADVVAPWGVAQKQTGADRLSIGGALAANVHGRGLAMKPIVADVESFVLVDAEGTAVRCSRDENAELFELAIGGYGLLGCIYSATIRLRPRCVLERVVEVRTVEELVPLFEQRIDDGYLYGDFQFATDERSDDFLRRGVFSCYRPVEAAGPPPEGQRALSRDDWRRLLYLAHVDKARAFEEYSLHYLATTGQLYYSDAHQLADYTDGYHAQLDAALGTQHRATEMISELYVPRARLADFLAAVADELRESGVSLVYGTIRLIERDDETFLAWATQPWGCVIVNLCTPHTDTGLADAAQAFRALIDLAVERGGSYYLTYHRWARRDQVEACYPQLPEFLRRKRRLDPAERFQSEWYRHYTEMFAEV